MTDGRHANGWFVSDPESNFAKPPKHSDDNATRPVSNRALAIFFAMLITALMLGYLFLNKLADISQEEDCALGNRYNCGAVVAPGR
jgi:hypothetical protein